MKLLRGISFSPRIGEPVALAVGNFDGVHLGHQALIAQLQSEAKKRGLATMVVVFEPQPSEFFLEDKAPLRLTTFREKFQLFQDMGIDYLWCLPFHHAMAEYPPHAFLQHVLFAHASLHYIVVGQDFRFGRARKGDVSTLCAYAAQVGCEAWAFSDVHAEGARVSSTRIRQALEKSDFEAAKRLLGRPYAMHARVVRGNGQAGKWGIPTANLCMNRHASPLKGVFCVDVQRENGQSYHGVANLGVRPTVDGTRRVLEVHLFDVSAQLYGERLCVTFLHKLRDEVKFSSVDALVARIHQDVQTARDFFLQTII